MTPAELRALDALDAAEECAERGNGAWPSGPRVIDVAELLALKLEPREFVLDPILRMKDLAMLHSWRGVGKTHVLLNVGFAIASAGVFLGWKAPRPRRVLYLDGEMPAETMQERLSAIIRASDHADTFDPKNLRFVCADLQEDGLPNLATPEGQTHVADLVAEAEVVIVDSISTLASEGRENEAESWSRVQAWALALRRLGKAVLFAHHDGKGLAQRGTSKREDVLDTVVQLLHPPDYEASEGARFEVHFKKARALHGAAVEPFEARLDVVDGRAEWTVRKLADLQLGRAVAMFRQGAKPEDVATELDVHRATAYRLRSRAMEKGLL